MNKPSNGPQNIVNRSNVLVADDKLDGVEKKDIMLIPRGTAIQTSISLRLVNPRKSFFSKTASAVVKPSLPRSPFLGV